MIAVYLRVSSQDQNPESQRAEIQHWLDQQHIPADQVRWFEDHESGKTVNRTEFCKLSAAIAKGKIDTVVCWKLDRLSRNFLDGVRLIGDWTKRGVRIVSVTQGFDLSGMTGQLVASVLFAVAEMELAHSKERQAAGIRLAKENGIYKGRKPGTHKGSPQRAKELKGRGLTEAEIASALNVTTRTVARYLRA